MTSLTPITIEAAAELMRAGRTTSVELTREAFARADAVDHQLGSYVARFDESAITAAERADAELAAGRDRGPLHGIPLGVKDIIATSEGPTKANSLAVGSNWLDRDDAPVVARLRQAGAVICGKTSTMEFACGVPDSSDPRRVPRNPWDLNRWCGGSSSGTGNGVAAGLFLGGIGTDSGGSIRCPATYCGITGHKPTFGLIPMSGCMPVDTSLDTVGTLTRSAWGAAALLNAMAGPDPADRTTVSVDIPDYVAALDGSLDGVRVGVDLVNTLRRASLGSLVDPLVEPVFARAIGMLKDAGATIREVELPLFTELHDTALLTFAAEGFTYHRDRLQARWNDYGPTTRLALITGAMVSAGDYVRVQRVRQFGRDELRAAFENLDVIITPTACAGAPEIEAQALAIFANQLFTATWNATGFPAVSVPMGFVTNGMPIGMQIAGRPFDDAGVLKVADAYQRLTSWHLEVPA